MLPHRPRAGLRVAVPALVALLLTLSGCGETSEKKEDGPSKQTVACRSKWKDLGEDVAGRDTATNPSVLPERWNSIAATIDYYATSANDGDCLQPIIGQKQAMAALAAFSKRVAPYDMQLQLEQVSADATKYAGSPRPPATGTGKKKQQPPKPADVKTALATLTKQAPVATAQQKPAWQQATVIDLADKAAVTKALKDLAFLSSESAAYRASRASLAQIKAALAATG